MNRELPWGWAEHRREARAARDRRAWRRAWLWEPAAVTVFGLAVWIAAHFVGG